MPDLKLDEAGLRAAQVLTAKAFDDWEERDIPALGIDQVPAYLAEAAITAYLEATRASQTEGWKADPNELTDEMLQAGEDAFVIRFAYVPANPWDAVGHIYRAMLAAAPSSPKLTPLPEGSET